MISIYLEVKIQKFNYFNIISRTAKLHCFYDNGFLRTQTRIWAEI